MLTNVLILAAFGKVAERAFAILLGGDRFVEGAVVQAVAAFEAFAEGAGGGWEAGRCSVGALEREESYHPSRPIELRLEFAPPTQQHGRRRPQGREEIA